MNLRGSNNNICARGQIGRGGWWGREKANHMEFGKNDIIVWEAVQLKPCWDVNVGDVSIIV